MCWYRYQFYFVFHLFSKREMNPILPEGCVCVCEATGYHITRESACERVNMRVPNSFLFFPFDFIFFEKEQTRVETSQRGGTCVSCVYTSNEKENGANKQRLLSARN